MQGPQYNDTVVSVLSKKLMKSGTLARVHRKGNKAGDHDRCFKETEPSSKEIRLWTSIDAILKDTDGPTRERITADSAKCGESSYFLARVRLF